MNYADEFPLLSGLGLYAADIRGDGMNTIWAHKATTLELLLIAAIANTWTTF